MLIFGCDYHSGFQHAALVDSATGVRRTAVGTPRRSRWHANWRGICTGCGATATGTDYVRNSSVDADAIARGEILSRSQALEQERLAQVQEQLEEQRAKLLELQEEARRAGMHTQVYDP